MKRHRLTNIALVGLGFILSPLTWWNDLVVNVPLAYLFATPFSLLHDKLFLPAFIIGYWLTNLLGFLLMHWGGEGLLYKRRANFTLNRSLLISVLYTVIIVIMVLSGWIASPSEFLSMFR